MKKIIYSLMLLPLIFSASCGDWLTNIESTELSEDTNTEKKETKTNLKSSYKVIFKNNKTIIDTLTVKTGEKPVYKKKKPFRDTTSSSGSTTFNIFVGWSEDEKATKDKALSAEDLPEVTKDTTYHAIFDKQVVEGEFTYNEANALSGFTNNQITDLVIPSSTTIIGNYSFQSFSNLKTVTIPENVTEIGSGCFDNCKQLVSVSLSDNILIISESLFRYCESLLSISIPSKVKSIGLNAFTGCKSLTSIVLPNQVGNISMQAFYNCTALESLTIPISVMNIGSYSLKDCPSVEVNYLGTKEQFGKIKIPDTGLEGSKKIKVTCTDGSLEV